MLAPVANLGSVFVSLLSRSYHSFGMVQRRLSFSGGKPPSTLHKRVLCSQHFKHAKLAGSSPQKAPPKARAPGPPQGSAQRPNACSGDGAVPGSVTQKRWVLEPLTSQALQNGNFPQSAWRVESAPDTGSSGGLQGLSDQPSRECVPQQPLTLAGHPAPEGSRPSAAGFGEGYSPPRAQRAGPNASAILASAARMGLGREGGELSLGGSSGAMPGGMSFSHPAQPSGPYERASGLLGALPPGSHAVGPCPRNGSAPLQGQNATRGSARHMMLLFGAELGGPAAVGNPTSIVPAAGPNLAAAGAAAAAGAGDGTSAACPVPPPAASAAASPSPLAAFAARGALLSASSAFRDGTGPKPLSCGSASRSGPPPSAESRGVDPCEALARSRESAQRLASQLQMLRPAAGPLPTRDPPAAQPGTFRPAPQGTAGLGELGAESRLHSTAVLAGSSGAAEAGGLLRTSIAAGNILQATGEVYIEWFVVSFRVHAKS